MLLIVLTGPADIKHLDTPWGGLQIAATVDRAVKGRSCDRPHLAGDKYQNCNCSR